MKKALFQIRSHHQREATVSVCLIQCFQLIELIISIRKDLFSTMTKASKKEAETSHKEDSCMEELKIHLKHHISRTPVDSILQSTIIIHQDFPITKSNSRRPSAKNTLHHPRVKSQTALKI